MAVNSLDKVRKCLGGPSPRIAGSVNRLQERANGEQSGGEGAIMQYDPEAQFLSLTALSGLLACGAVLAAMAGYPPVPTPILAVVFALLAVGGIFGQRSIENERQKIEKEQLRLRAIEERNLEIRDVIAAWLHSQGYMKSTSVVKISEIYEGLSSRHGFVVLSGSWADIFWDEERSWNKWDYNGFFVEVGRAVSSPFAFEIHDAVFVNSGRIIFSDVAVRRAAFSRRSLIEVIRTDFTNEVELTRPFLS